MSTPAHRRHDISDRVWSLLEPHLPGRQSAWGRVAEDNRRFINGVFWILRTGAPWRDLHTDYGDWKNTHRRFCRWRDKGIWEKLLEQLVNDPDFEWLMIDASHIKVHPDATGAKGGNQEMGLTKGGSIPRYIWPWMRMVCRSELLLQAVPQQIVHKLRP
ncbi:transposase [Xenorhabdus ehlersii]|uniref:Transposase n=1 Tax=Xenorhabdus ehlersii TaxID=290111 RepID=A0ABX9PHA0_9GAMM|nr:transposase [Xenorhabdus ehlersii]RKE93085.1 transposase [Xenorhabdus ehlersii]